MQDRAATARAGTKAKNVSEGFKDCMCFTVRLWVTATSSEHPRLHSIDVIVPLLLSCSIFSPIFPQLTKREKKKSKTEKEIMTATLSPKRRARDAYGAVGESRRSVIGDRST